MRFLDVEQRAGEGRRILHRSLALSEKVEQIRVFEGWAESALSGNPELREGALAWTEAVGNRLLDVGGVGVAPSASAPAAGPLSGSKLTPFPRAPPETRVFGHAAFTGLT